MTIDAPHTIRLSVQNLTERPLTVSLEPLGEWRDLQPGETRGVTYRLDQEPALEISVTNDALLIGDDGEVANGDGLVFERDGHR